MTEMVYGSMPARVGEPVLPRWWRTIDKWSLTCAIAPGQSRRRRYLLPILEMRPKRSLPPVE